MRDQGARAGDRARRGVGARPRVTSAISAEPRRVAVVIPTWNGGPRFVELLRRLAEQDVEGGLQLVVVDSGSRDGSAGAARRAGAFVVEIPQSEFGHGRTRNRAIELTSADVVCLLTQDALPLGPDYVRTLVAAFDDPRVDGAYARQEPQPDCDPIIAERLKHWTATRPDPVDQSLAPGDPAAARAAWDALSPHERLAACAFDNVASALRRTTWVRHPFPEATFGEDVAWGKQVLLDGGTIRYEPRARVEHSHRVDLVREFKRLYCDHRNLATLFELVNVPSWRKVWDGWHWQRRRYFELLDGAADLGTLRRIGWKLYAIPYSLAEPAAQFLGARSNWKTRESGLWRWFDGKVRAKT
ncbi:MAG: glycosyltransferase [Planctomycetota bacterium]